jgi:hypothetical protein
MREFEEQAQKLVSQALSICEVEVANCDDPASPRKMALCAAALSVQEAFKTFLTLLKSV